MQCVVISNDQLIFTFVNEGKGSASWPFDKKFHLLMNSQSEVIGEVRKELMTQYFLQFMK
jgi:hypothetical protein